MAGNEIPLVLTMGEPGGIGPEIAAKAWLARHEQKVPAFIYLGSVSDFQRRMDSLGLEIPYSVYNLGNPLELFKKSLPVCDIPLPVPSVPGQFDLRNSKTVIQAIDRSVDMVANGVASAIVTNPINKESLLASGFKHSGHTDYLSELGRKYDPEAKAVMMLASDELKVVPATVHIPLKDVPSTLTSELLVECGKIVVRDLRERFSINNPKIYFSGLNPHAGENGHLGMEDREIIQPAIEALKNQNIDASGPYPADTMFHTSARKNYDVAIAMYHDQALIPIKTIAFDTGVNVTLGLPFIRTSPDHGTAFDIADKGIADPQSLISALKMADEMARDQRIFMKSSDV